MIRHLKRFGRWLWRSAITGKFVSHEYADEHAKTTTKERV